jgi:hypothetical protein
MLLAVTLLILISSYGFDDNVGQIFSIFIISIAGAESVIGLSILVAYYRLNSSLISTWLSCGHKTYSKNVNKFSSKIIKKNYTTSAKTNNQSRNYLIEP